MIAVGALARYELLEAGQGLGEVTFVSIGLFVGQCGLELPYTVAAGNSRTHADLREGVGEAANGRDCVRLAQLDGLPTPQVVAHPHGARALQ